MNNIDLNIIAFLFTTIALVIAGWQFYQARKQTNELSEIKDSLSTRFIDRFPDYLIKINDLLNEAKNSIEIVCDVPGFGHFSQPDNWFEYLEIIRKKKHQGLNINITFHNREIRQKFRKEQFAQASGGKWNDWKLNPEIKPKMEKFLKKSNIEISVDKIEFSEFINLLESSENEIINHDFKGLSITEVKSNIAIYFWIIDGRKAIFAIPSFSKEYPGFLTYGFITSDPRLISTFHALKRKLEQWNKE